MKKIGKSKNIERYYWCTVFLSLLFIVITIVGYQYFYPDLTLLAAITVVDVLFYIVIYMVVSDIDEIHRVRQFTRYWQTLESQHTDVCYLRKQEEILLARQKRWFGRKLNALKLDLVREMIGVMAKDQGMQDAGQVNKEVKNKL